jgi:nitrite reductase/ring-hydroxylating ferredoxin subunit
VAERKRLICQSADLADRGLGVKFPMPELGEHETGFVVRCNGSVHGYVNQCAHVPVALDWQEGDFFDLERHYLICATHGAQYQPETGFCVMGPCKGRSLQKLDIVEHDGKIYLIEHSPEEG